MQKKEKLIVIAEDSPTQALKLEFLLSENGFKVLVAKSGEEAFNMVMEYNPDMVISDILMPGITGYELCKKIKSTHALKDIPVLLLTTLTQSENIVRAVEVGADFYFTKPYQEDYLISKVKSVFDGSDDESDQNRIQLPEDQQAKVKPDSTKMISLLVNTYEQLKDQNQELKAAHQEIHELNEHLNDKVKERTKDLLGEIEKNKIVQAELAESNNFKESLLSSISLAIDIVDENGIILYANNVMKKMAGEEVLGRHCWDIYRNDHCPCQDCPLKSDIREGETKTIIIHHVFNGRSFEIMHTGMVFKGRKAILEVFHDITERYQFEIQREAIYKIAQSAVAAVNLDDFFNLVHGIIQELMPAENFYIALIDEETQTMSFPYFADHFDVKPNSVKTNQGLTGYVLKHGKSLICHKADYLNLIKNGEVEPGGRLAEIWLGVPLILTDKIIGVMALQDYQDSGAFSEKESKILEYVSSQVAIAIEKKRNQEEIIREKERAEESSRLKSSLLMNMSHEFRTPMNGILGFAELLRNALNDTRLAHLADNILHSGNRLMDTLNTVIELSQLQADKQKIKLEPHDVSALTHEVCSKFLPRAEKKGLRLETHIEPGLVAKTDPTIYPKVIAILLDNAIKFTRAGSITVNVGVEKGKAGQFICIEVTDTGIGIAPEHFEMIFEEFRQISEGFGRAYEGNGLGLTLCKKFLELLKGDISLESSLGTGSTFRVSFPFENAENFKTTQSPESETVTINNPAETKGIPEIPRVLIVEDNEQNVELTSIYLAGKFETEWADDGRTAIEMARTKPYDVILMDINLGEGLNGMEVASEIRKIEGYRNKPIIAVTGYTTLEERNRILENGCSHYLTKPFKSNELLDIMNLAVNGTYPGL